MVRLIANRKDFFLLPLLLAGGSAIGYVVVFGNMLLFAPLVLLLLPGWVVFARKYPAAALIVIVFFTEDCFDLTTFGLRQRLLSDIGIALLLPVVLLNIRKVWNHVVRDRSPYGIAILLFFCAILSSLYFGSHIIFGQPILVGLTVARKYLIFLSYFFLVAVDATRKDCFQFLKYLAWLGGLIALLSIAESLLGGGVIFREYNAVGQERAGLLRVHVGTFIIAFSVIYSFLRLQTLPFLSRQQVGYTLLLFLGICALLFVVMTRAIILGLTVTFIVWQVRGISSRKIMVSSVAFSFVILLVLTGFFEKILDDTSLGHIVELTSLELGANEGNVSIRKMGANYYLDLMMRESPWVGVGLFSDTNYPNNPVTFAKEQYHFYTSDVNGISTFVFWGMQGVVLFLFFFIKSISSSIYAAKSFDEKYNFDVLLYVLIYTFATPTLSNIIVLKMLLYSGVFLYLLENVGKQEGGC